MFVIIVLQGFIVNDKELSMKSIHTLLASVLVIAGFFSPMAFADNQKQQDQPAKQVLNQAAVSTPVNINSANADVLAENLNGVGLKKAQAIVLYREQHGPFKSVDELVNVAGIGQATLAKNRDKLSVN
jgi:competence protein ComEA